jgi:hypothetical protein
MPWYLINSLLGHGPQWKKSPQDYDRAILKAHQMGRLDVVEHLEIMLKRRNLVMGDQPREFPFRPEE